MRKSVLDRRTFVMGSAGVGASALVGGMLAGCAPGPDGGARLSAQEPVPRIRLSFDGAAVEAVLDEGEAGDNVGLLMRGIDKKEVKRGMVVAKPGSITPHTKFEAEVYILKKEEGGRHTPFHNKYRPQFYLRTMDVTGEIALPEGVDMVMPGDHVTITVTLIYPVALNEGLRFAIREGGRTVGAGQIIKILE